MWQAPKIASWISSPVLIGKMQDAFDHLDWIYELKLDNVRSVVSLDSSSMELMINDFRIQPAAYRPASKGLKKTNS